MYPDDINIKPLQLVSLCKFNRIIVLKAKNKTGKISKKHLEFYVIVAVVHLLYLYIQKLSTVVLYAESIVIVGDSLIFSNFNLLPSTEQPKSS
ncbi:hypothetical protein CN938_11130 [Bacillus thuringiensis]|nr:hypothetical protein CN938_11130 [Bacillus thuringiensis]